MTFHICIKILLGIHVDVVDMFDGNIVNGSQHETIMVCFD